MTFLWHRNLSNKTKKKLKYSSAKFSMARLLCQNVLPVKSKLKFCLLFEETNIKAFDEEVFFIVKYVFWQIFNSLLNKFTKWKTTLNCNHSSNEFYPNDSFLLCRPFD